MTCIFMLVRGLMAINVGCDFCNRSSIPSVYQWSRMLTLGKLADLNYSLIGGLLLD